MSISISIQGVVPPDETYHKMTDAWFACEKAGVKVPDKVLEYFDHETPDAAGLTTHISYSKDNGVTEWSDANYAGYEIDLSKLDPKFKILRVALG